MLKTSSLRQRGVSLVELMVGLAIGLIIVGAASTVYVNAVRSGSDTLRSAKLNIELRGAMDMMVGEIRRAGYSSASSATSLSNNPFTQSTTDVSSPSIDCILFSYDADSSGAVNTADFFGFKKNGSAVSMRDGGTAPTTSAGCSATGDAWEKITDDNNIVVDTLTFAISYQCLNAKTSVSSTTQPCAVGNSVYDTAAAATPKADLVEIRSILITLVGHHISDTSTTMTLSQSVRIRNDRIQTVGL